VAAAVIQAVTGNWWDRSLHETVSVLIYPRRPDAGQRDIRLAAGRRLHIGQESQDEACFIGAGIGVTPFRSMV